MKARPRSVENRVAEAMSVHFVKLGLSAVERIPVLGRTGPDLTINELGLVVDVKSRKEVPKKIFSPLLWPFCFDQLVGVRLSRLDLLWKVDCIPVPFDFSSRIIRGYWTHMEAWTRVERPDGISCIVLHRPEMPIGQSVAIIHSKDRRRLIEYANRYRFNSPGE